MGDADEYTEIASDCRMREVVAQHLVGQLLQRHHAFPRMQFYMMTVIDDPVRTKDLRCTLRFRALVKKVHNALAYADVRDWFGVKEIQPYVNWEAGYGRDLAPHLHLILMTDGPLTRRQRRRLTRSQRFESFTEAPTVKLTQRLNVDGELAQMIYYLLKQPERGANLVPPRIRIQLGIDGPEEVCQGYRQLDAAIRPDLAIRLTEALSQLRLSQLLISGGEGKAMTSATRLKMRQVRTRTVHIPDVALAWAEARRLAGKQQYLPIVIDPYAR